MQFLKISSSLKSNLQIKFISCLNLYDLHVRTKSVADPIKLFFANEDFSAFAAMLGHFLSMNFSICNTHTHKLNREKQKTKKNLFTECVTDLD
jgi:hypothetical protein